VIAWIIVIAHILGFLTSIDAAMSTRTAQGAIAWVIGLNTMPLIAVPAYAVLGRRNFSGYVESRRDHEEEIDRLVQKISTKLRPYAVTIEDRDPAFEGLTGLADMPMLDGNLVELLIDGAATFDSIFEGIERAEEYVLVEFFIIKDDGLGRRLKEALMEKARQGVRCYVVYDEIGSHRLPMSYGRDLREAGVEVSEFNTRQGHQNRFQLNFRNHRKIVVVDGREAWIGGHNVGDEYLGLGKLGPWRDTHLRIAGPAVQQAQAIFLADWFWATRTFPDLNWKPVPADGEGARALILPTSPADPIERAQLFFVHALNSAHDRIWIASPYFVPDEAVIAALHLAALRGVDVRILLPNDPDHLAVYLCSFWYIDDLEEVDVHFYRYTGGFLHQKVMLIDDAVATVGTANFDNRSFRLNFEVTAVVADPDFVLQVQEMLLADFEQSEPVPEGLLGEKSFLFRLGVRLARLTAPLQ